MNSAAIGIGYAIWLRIWWLLCGLLATIVAFAIAEQFASNDVNEFLLPTAWMAVIFLLVPVLSALTYSPADLGAKGSGFPTHMLVLPVSTQWLSAWPILFCSAIFATTWFLLAGLILIPAGFHPPILWPAAVLATGTAWIQALSWSPFPSPLVRVPALIAALMPLGLLMLWAGLNAKSAVVPILAAAVGVIWWLTAYGVAANGLSRARGGSQGDWFAWLVARWQARAKSMAAAPVDMRAAFRSADSAQLWHEIRRNLSFLLCMVVFLMVPLLMVLYSSVRNSSTNNGLMIGSTTIAPAMLALGAVIFVPVLLATMYGSGLAKFDIWGSEQVPSFFAIRPITSARFVGIKLKGMAKGALAIWGLILLVLTAWAALEASSLNPRPSLVRGFFVEATARNWAVMAVAIVGVLVLLWRNMAVGMWPTLTGRKWLSTVLAIQSMLVVLSLPGLAGWLSRQPDLREKLTAAMPWLLGAAVMTKLCVAVWVGAAIKRRGLVAGRAISFAFIAWSLAVACLTGNGAALVGWTWYLPIGAVLFTPLVRIGLAPLALDWNRHR